MEVPAIYIRAAGRICLNFEAASASKEDPPLHVVVAWMHHVLSYMLSVDLSLDYLLPGGPAVLQAVTSWVQYMYMAVHTIVVV